MRLFRKIVHICLFSWVINSAFSQVVASFNCTGSQQSYTVPDGVCKLKIKAWGAGGGGGGNDAFGGGIGGGGSYAEQIISVSPGDILTIFAGCKGNPGFGGSGTPGGSGGWGYGKGGNGGNAGPACCSGSGGGGGGSSAVALNGTAVLVAAGGGGGGGGGCKSAGGNGGSGNAAGGSTTCTGGGAAAANAAADGANGSSHVGDGGGGGGGGGGAANGGSGGAAPPVGSSCNPLTDCGAGGGGGGNSLGTVTDGSGSTPGNSSDSDLCSGCAQGASGPQTAGTDGFVAIISVASSATPLNFTISPQNVLCNGQCNGAASVSISSGTSPFSYLWSNAQTAVSATGLCAGNYTCTVTDSGGCSKNANVSITEPAPLTVTVVASPPICSNSPIGTTVAGASGGSSPYAYLWNTSGTQVSLNNLPSGTYTVTTTDNNGCTGTAQATVVLNPVPVPDFTAENVCVYDSAIFINTSAIASGTMTWSWNMDDGTSYTQEDIAHLFGNYGAYDVSLSANSDSGCTATVSHTFYVHPVPEADFFVAGSCLDSISFFDNNSSIPSGSIASWDWDFGDGDFSADESPSHEYIDPGDYGVTLIAISDSGCIGKATNVVEKYAMPVADFNPTIVCFSDSTQFYDWSYISSGSIVSWLWVFGDGTPNANQQNPYHFYPLGDHSVTLIVSSDKGCIDDSMKEVGVFPLPVVAFDCKNNCFNEQPGIFSDKTTISAGSLSSWSWDFGDPVSAVVDSSQNPVHNFSSIGAYEVKLKVVSDKGCTDSLQKQIPIFPAPQTEFAVDDTAGCQPHCVNFSDATVISQGNISKWKWGFGITENAGQDTVQNPSPCYLDEGVFTVSLIAVSDNGCKDTMIKNNYITVYPLPVADFAFTPQPTTIQDMNIIFSDISAGTVAEWAWKFYDNDKSTILGTSVRQNPSFNFATYPTEPFLFFLGDTGEYPVQLVAATINGCRDSIVKTVVVDGVFYVNTPNAFTPNSDGINDFFFPSGIGIDPFEKFSLYIFNRWGDLIFESHSLKEPWDGTNGGSTAVQQDVYVWVIELKEATRQHKKHRYTGHITVVR